MFRATDDKIGIREYISIIVIVFYSKITDSTPTLFLKEGMTAGWVTPLISGLIMFLVLYSILRVLKKYEGKGLIEVIYILLGKYVGFFISLLIFLTFLVFALTNSSSYASILTIIFFPNTNIIVLYFFLMLSSATVAYWGLKSIGRTARLLIPYIVVAMISILFLIKGEVRTEYLFPLQGSGIKNLLKSGVMLNSVFAEIVIFMTFRPMIRNYKEFKLSTIIGFWVSVVNMMIFFAVYIMCFDYPPVIIINYPFHTLIRFISVSRFFTNFEALYLLFWIIIAVIRFAMYLYILSGVFAQMIKSTKVEALIPAFAVIVFMLGLIPENHIITVQFIRLTNIRITSILYLILPVILLVGCKVKGD